MQPAPAHACQCAVKPSPCEAAWRADVSFIGKVERVELIGKGGRVPALRPRIVTFIVSEHFRGPGGTRIRVPTGSGGGDCGYRFHEGQQYLVYAMEDREGQLSTNVCTRTSALGAAAEDLKYLRAAFERREPLGQISGTIYRQPHDLIRPPG